MNINLLITLMKWHHLLTQDQPFTNDEFHKWLDHIYGGA